MRSFPGLFLHTLCPTPKATLSERRWSINEILMQVNAVAAGFVDHESQFMSIMCDGLVSIDFSGEILGRHFALACSHMAHLRPVKVHTITGRVDSFVTSNTHCRIDVHVTLRIGDVKIGRRRRTPERR